MKEPQPTLFIVATPIGTLSDFSSRARLTLESVDFIACEDTRRTKELLMALQVQHGPLISLHEHNERGKSESLISRLLNGKQLSAALVSDAGTPAISDPGALFVDACHQHQIRVESVPGPSSLVAAAAASGFLRPRLIFSGFLSRNSNDQKEEFNRWKHCSPCLAVCFESPHRVLDTLRTAAEVFPENLQICLSREISKKFEEHIRGSLSEVIGRISESGNIRGECVICFDLPNEVLPTESKVRLTLPEVTTLALDVLSNDSSVKVKELTKKLADEHGLNAKDLYNAVVGGRKS